MRIAVYTLGKGRARPDYYISQADALERIRLNDAERAGKHAIVMLSVKRPSHSRPTLNNWYIPENMPPVDLPGVKFVPPTRKDHAFSHLVSVIADGLCGQEANG